MARQQPVPEDAADQGFRGVASVLSNGNRLGRGGVERRCRRLPARTRQRGIRMRADLPSPAPRPAEAAMREPGYAAAAAPLTILATAGIVVATLYFAREILIPLALAVL